MFVAIGDLNLLEHTAPPGAMVPTEMSAIPTFPSQVGSEKLNLNSRPSAFTPVATAAVLHDSESSFLSNTFFPMISSSTNALAASSAFSVLPSGTEREGERERNREGERERETERERERERETEKELT